MTEERKAAVPATVAAVNAQLVYDPDRNTVGGAPPDREAMLDVLRASYVLFRDTKNNVGAVMPDELASAVRNIYGVLSAADPALPDERRLRETAFDAIMTDETLFEIPERLRSQSGETMEKFRDHLARWNELNDEERLELLRHVAMVVAGIYGLGDFDVEGGKLSSYGTSALWKGSQSGNAADVMLVDFSDEDPEDGGMLGLARLDDLIHELGHAYQEKLIRQFRAGEITPDDQRYQQVAVFVLSQAYYNVVTVPLRSTARYFHDPREAHAEANKKAWVQFRQTLP